MRLNAAMKTQVIKKALDHKFKKRLKDHEDEAKAIGQACWTSLFGEYKRAIEKLPKQLLTFPRFFNHHNDAHANVNFTFGGQYHQYPVLRTLPVDSGNGRMTVTDTTLIERHRAFLAENDAIKVETEKVSATLNAMLKNIQTYARLESDWPEGKKFYHSLPVDFPFQHQVPAVQVKELNALLGLAA